jgi:glutathione S-transferase
MITVHHLNNSRSQRVLWLLEEMGYPYEVRRYDRDAQSMLAPDSLKAVHPLGKSPVITHEGRVIAETGAIVEYILDLPGGEKLRPAPGSPSFLDYRYWLHYAEGSAMTPLLLKLVFMRLGAGAPLLMRPLVNAIAGAAQTRFIDPQIAMHMAYQDAALSRTGWFAGEGLTGADIMMSFPLEAASLRASAGGPYPHIAAFLTAIHARPAYRIALEKGGPYDYA